MGLGLPQRHLYAGSLIFGVGGGNWLVGPSAFLEVSPSTLPLTAGVLGGGRGGGKEKERDRERPQWFLIQCPHSVVSQSTKETLRLWFG